MNYVLISPARNEAAFIRKALDSVCAQSLLPLRYVVVDDGSTDRTAEIVQEYTRQYSWIELVQRPRNSERSFAGKVHAFNAGFERVKHLEFDVVGNFDADISFDSEYMAFLLGKFNEDPTLGVAGTAMVQADYDSTKDSFYSEQDVFGACQLFRRKCFLDVGGYTPIRWGGIDWVAVRTARFKGWRTRSFREHPFFHHRPMGATESNVWRAKFDYGRKDYFLGNHPLWQLCRIGFQMLKKPYLIGGLILSAGYFYSLVSGMERPVAPELVRFHRREQLARLRNLCMRFTSPTKT